MGCGGSKSASTTDQGKQTDTQQVNSDANQGNIFFLIYFGPSFAFILFSKCLSVIYATPLLNLTM